MSVETTLTLSSQRTKCFIVSRGAVCAEWNKITCFISLGFVQKGEEKAFSSGFYRSQDSSIDFDRKRKYCSCHCWISAGELFSSIVSNICCNRTTPILLPLCKRIRHHSLQLPKDVRNPRWKFFLLNREFSFVLPGYSCTFNLYFDLLPNPSSDTTGSSEHLHGVWQSQGAFQLQCQHSGTGTSAVLILLWRVFFGCKPLSILPKSILLNLSNAYFQL